MKRSRRHALGQHFLRNRAVLDRIVGVVDPRPGDFILEIGAGQGALTFRLAARGAMIAAVEKDSRLVPGLQAEAPPNVRVIGADILRLDFRDLVPEAARGSAKVAGNLPYAISSPLLFKVLDGEALFSSAVFLIQKEVAERLCARPGSKAFAPLAILLQDVFDPKLEFTVAPGSFAPPPRVDSALVSLRRRETPVLGLARDPGFREFLRRAFGQRRKKLRNNLSAGPDEPGRAPGPFRAALDAAFEEIGLDPGVRAEDVPAAGLAALYCLLRRDK